MTPYSFWKKIRTCNNAIVAAIRTFDEWCIKRMFQHEQGRETATYEIVQSTIVHNMMQHPDEPFYARLYWEYIGQELDGLTKIPGDILDLGCGQGRLTIPLAKKTAGSGMKIVAVDISQPAINEAVEHCRAQGLENVVDFRAQDIKTFLEERQQNSASIILCTEVLLYHPDHEQVLAEIGRVLAPEGMAFVAFRSRYFNAMHTIQNGMWDYLPMILERNSGHVWGNKQLFSWFDAKDIPALLAKAGLHCVWTRGIGVCSGCEGDPLSSLARPGKLNALEHDALARAESHFAEELASAGRYVLAAIRSSR